MHGTSQKLYVLVEALLYIAYNSTMQPLGGKKLADILDVPPRYLELLLQALVREKILRSVRGPRGGYMLARERRMIRMDDVFLAIEQDRLERHEREAPVRQSVAYEKLVMPMFEAAEAAFVAELGKVTLDDLCDKTQRMDLAHLFVFRKQESIPRLDFSI
jgi:Rrf2 family transcriptional regulator, iron-sulfur cluster assembly transcription factor